MRSGQRGSEACFCIPLTEAGTRGVLSTGNDGALGVPAPPISWAADRNVKHLNPQPSLLQQLAFAENFLPFSHNRN
jgi:hypothetical protein